MNISVITNKQCNFNCDFCYLSSIDKQDKTILNLDTLKSRFENILNKFNLTNFESINIYGGEVSLLSDIYIDKLISLCKIYSSDISIVSNGLIQKRFFEYPFITKSISFDYDIRENYKKVLKNITKYKDINILLLVSKRMYEKYSNESILEIINTLNEAHIKNISIIQYSQIRDIQVPYWYYDKFVLNFLKYKDFCNFSITNYDILMGYKKVSLLSNNHIFINNDGKYSEIKYDKNGNEYFIYYDSLDDVVSFFNEEKQLYNKNWICKDCEFKNCCIGEHYREVFYDPTIHSCSGNYMLMKEFQKWKSGK